MLGVEELYHRYRDDVFRYLCSLTHDPVLAEDLLSETFLCAIQKAGSFRGEGSERTWLFGIARNLWLQALRRHRPTVELSDLLGLYVEDTVGSALDSRQLTVRVRQLLEELPPRERTIVRLRAEGLPYEEIAARCGIRAGSARVIEYRTRQRRACRRGRVCHCTGAAVRPVLLQWRPVQPLFVQTDRAALSGNDLPRADLLGLCQQPRHGIQIRV